MKENASVSQLPGADAKALWHGGRWTVSDMWVRLPPTPCPSSIFSVNTRNYAAFSGCFALLWSIFLFMFSVLSALMNFPLVFFTVSCCNKRIWFLKPIWKTSFLAFRVHLHMSGWERMVLCRLGGGPCWLGVGMLRNNGHCGLPVWGSSHILHECWVAQWMTTVAVLFPPTAPGH